MERNKWGLQDGGGEVTGPDGRSRDNGRNEFSITRSLGEVSAGMRGISATEDQGGRFKLEANENADAEVVAALEKALKESGIVSTAGDGVYTKRDHQMGSRAIIERVLSQNQELAGIVLGSSDRLAEAVQADREQSKQRQNADVQEADAILEKLQGK